MVTISKLIQVWQLSGSGERMGTSIEACIGTVNQGSKNPHVRRVQAGLEI